MIILAGLARDRERKNPNNNGDVVFKQKLLGNKDKTEILVLKIYILKQIMSGMQAVYTALKYITINVWMLKIYSTEIIYKCSNYC